MSPLAPPHPPDPLSEARATLDILRAQSTALSSQLESLNYANELTSAELSRRSPPVTPPPSLPPSPPSPSPPALESALLASKSSCAATRQRIHALRAQIAALRARVASQHVLAAGAALSAPPRRRGSAARTIAQLDAFVRLGAGAPLLPCHAVISAAGTLAVKPARSTAALVEVGPHFARVDVDDAPVDAAAVAMWFRCLDVHARARGGGGGGEDMVLCGLPGTLRDAQALVESHDPSLFGAENGGRAGCGLRRESLPGPPRGQVSRGVSLLDSTGGGDGGVAHPGVAPGWGARERAAAGVASVFGGVLDDLGFGAWVERSVDRGLLPSDSSARPAPRGEAAEVVAVRVAQPGRGNAEASAAPKPAVMLGGKSGILSPETAGRLLHALPARFATCNLRLLYSTRVHGISLQSMYAKGAGKSPTIIALRDSGGARFGCFATAPWVRAAKPAYYGTGESFCWAARGEDVDLFKWTRKNSYFQCSGAEYFAFGGGGHYAVRMGDDLLHGTSGECDTFGSPCLSSTRDFSCVVLELWSVEATAFTRQGGR